MTRLRILAIVLNVAIVVALLAGSRPASAQEPAGGARPKTPIEHFIVVMQENHTFDNYFGTYPGADGIPAGTCMPVDPTDPANTQCIEPFHLGDNDVQPADLDHSTATHRLQYNDGRMDGFVSALRRRNQDGRLAMGYYDARDLPYYWKLAGEYVLFDRFFSSVIGGSFLNHIYWVAAAPGDGKDRMPQASVDVPTIFDRLDAAGISWKFYVQNYDPGLTYRTVTAAAGNRASQVIWVPLLNIDRFIDDPKLSSRIVDLDQYYEDLHNGTLPAVAYIAPSGASEHPPGSLRSGQRFVNSLINALKRSDAWESSAFLLVYDDWGGWYDHVPPPQVDEYGYGFRVPAMLVSPYARRGHVDSTELDFSSIPRFIGENWDLEPLAERDAKSNSMMGAFDFSQEPRSPRFILASDEPLRKPVPPLIVIYAGYGVAFLLPFMMIGWAACSSRRPEPPSAPAEPRSTEENAR